MNVFVYFRNFVICSFAIVFFSFVFGNISYAQTAALTLNISPRSPGPFQNVTISVEDYSADLNKTDISWSINGKLEKKGVGIKQFSFRTGALGSVNTVTINMGGEVKEVTIRPAKVDLIWQADTFTPPFYLGKALHSNQDPITVIAEPFFLDSKGIRINPDTLIYRWKRDDKVNGAASGYGKRTFKIVPSVLLKPSTVEVEVTSADGMYSSASSVIIPDSPTEVLAYEDHPLYGIRFQNALNGKEFEISNQEADIMAFPFFFSNQQNDTNELVYNWRLNNNPINQKGNEVTFRKPDGIGSGRSAVSVDIKNVTRFMQTSNTNFFATFMNEAPEVSGPNIF